MLAILNLLSSELICRFFPNLLRYNIMTGWRNEYGRFCSARGIAFIESNFSHKYLVCMISPEPVQNCRGSIMKVWRYYIGVSLTFHQGQSLHYKYHISVSSTLYSGYLLLKQPTDSFQSCRDTCISLWLI